MCLRRGGRPSCTRWRGNVSHVSAPSHHTQAGAALAPPCQPICFSPHPEAASTHANILCLTTAISKNALFRRETNEKQGKKKKIFSKEDKEMRDSSCLPCLRELLCIQGLAWVENDAVVSQRTHVELNL